MKNYIQIPHTEIKINIDEWKIALHIKTLWGQIDWFLLSLLVQAKLNLVLNYFGVEMAWD